MENMEDNLTLLNDILFIPHGQGKLYVYVYKGLLL